MKKFGYLLSAMMICGGCLFGCGNANNVEEVKEPQQVQTTHEETESEQAARQKVEEQQQKEAEKKAQEEQAKKEAEEAEQKAKEEQAKKEAEEKAKEEEEQRQKEEAEAKAKAEEEAKQEEIVMAYEVAQTIVDSGNQSFNTTLSRYEVDEENKTIMVCVDAPAVSELAGYVLVLPTSENLSSWNNDIINNAKYVATTYKTLLNTKGLTDWHISIAFGSVEKDSFHVITYDDVIMYDAVNDNLN